MEPQWYWKSGGQQHGPVTTGQLEALIRQNKIHDSDSVRLDQAEEWTPASEIRATFSGSGAPETTAASAARALAEGRRAQLNLATGAVDDSSGFGGRLAEGFANLCKGFLWQCGNLLSIIAGWFSFGGGSKPATPPANGGGVISNYGQAAASTLQTRVTLAPLLRHKVAIIGVLLLVLSCVALKTIVFDDFENQKAYDQLSKIWGELDRVQGIVTKEFRDKTLAEVEPLQTRLETRYAKDSRAKTGYWSDVGFRGATARAHLVQCCKILHEILQSEKPSSELNQLFVGQLNLADRNLASNRTTRQSWLSSVDPTITGIVIVDGLAIAGFVLWWRRRAKK